MKPTLNQINHDSFVQNNQNNLSNNQNSEQKDNINRESNINNHVETKPIENLDGQNEECNNNPPPVAEQLLTNINNNLNSGINTENICNENNQCTSEQRVIKTEDQNNQYL